MSSAARVQVVAVPLNTKPKHVASRTRTGQLEWQNSSILEGELPEAVAALKEQDGGDLLVIGSTERRPANAITAAHSSVAR